MIRPGEEWGELAEIPSDTPVVTGDAALADFVREADAAFAGDDSDLLPLVALAGGDLCRTLGGRGDVDARLGEIGPIAAVDIGRARLDDDVEVLFVAHLVARRPLWRGSFAVVMNAGFLGPLRLAPRGHPGDGRFDLTEGSLPWRERLIARNRARTGDHLPHPGLRTRRIAAARLDLDRPMDVHVDGRRHRKAHSIDISRHPRRVLVAV
ncbi:MAG: hypothetical protein ACE367_13530 [Acidimicrobiales bacterium]